MLDRLTAFADRLTATALALVIAFAPLAAQASQNSLLSPTTGTVSGLQLTNTYNAALDSLNTANSGATAPANQLSGSASLGNWWLNTTSAPYPLGMYDGSSHWPAIGVIDPTAHAWDLQIGGGAATLASSATTDLCSVPQNYLSISGTTTITSFGSTCPAGVVKLVTFTGSLNITYNSVSLIIPGANSIQPTSVGDQATLISLGSGNWQIATYTPASGTALVNPAIDVGDYVMTSLIAPPSSKYLFAYGQAVSRTTYATLLAGETTTQSVTRTNGSPTLTGFTDTTQIPIGAAIEGSGIVTGAAISSCTSSTCTMTANASSSGTANVQIFPNGNGNGSTTFNLPNCAGVTLAGRDNMSGSARGVLTSTYYGTNPDALGAYGGEQAVTLTSAQIPTISTTGSGSGSGTVSGQTISASGINSSNAIPFTSSTSNVASQYASTTYTPTLNGFLYSSSASWFSASLGSLAVSSATVSISTSVSSNSNNTGGQAHPTVQPTLTANCMLRVL